MESAPPEEAEEVCRGRLAAAGKEGEPSVEPPEEAGNPPTPPAKPVRSAKLANLGAAVM